MNFFEAQEDARKKTKWLILLFGLAVVCLIILTNLLVYGIVMTFLTATESAFYFTNIVQNKSLFLWISVGVVVMVTAACIYKHLSFSSGGKAVAASLGGTLLHPDSNSINDRILLNVVEEMAIAAGMPVPQVFVLKHESGINAFAAGFNTKDAVIGVTQGCIDKLSREQLQGVVGHEFSHILNGDMRLNLRLLTVLFGLVFIANMGRLLMHGGHGRSVRVSPRGNKSSFAFLALGLFIIGSLGHFFARMIKASVNRQREFLADAASVQFTRDPKAVADALKVVGGHVHRGLVTDAHADEMSHLFFEASLSPKQWFKHFSWLASHPPLDERIKKLDPQWDGRYLKPDSKSEANADSKSASSNPILPSGGSSTAQRNGIQQLVTAASVFEQFENNGASNSTRQTDQGKSQSQAQNTSLSFYLPRVISEACHNSHDAIALVFVVTLSPCAFEFDSVIDQLQLFFEPKVALSLTKTMQSLSALVGDLGRAHFLTMIELSLPALKNLSKTQYVAFLKTLSAIVKDSDQEALQKWCYFTLLKENLTTHFGLKKKRTLKYRKLNEIYDQLQVILSLIAYEGHDTDRKALFAFGKAANFVGMYQHLLLDKEDVSMTTFYGAVNDLDAAFPLVKPKILKAVVMCIEHDGEVSVAELELVRTIGAAIDCPVPPILLSTS